MPRPPMSVEELRVQVSADEIDTVIVAITDMQGRLQGKRIDATHFLTDVLPGAILPGRRRSCRPRRRPRQPAGSAPPGPRRLARPPPRQPQNQR